MIAKQLEGVANLLQLAQQAWPQAKQPSALEREALAKAGRAALRKSARSTPLIKGMLGLAILALASCTKLEAPSPLPSGDTEFICITDTTQAP